MTEFLNMGGYAAFVWSAMGVVFSLMLIEPLILVIQRKSTLKNIRRIKRLEQRAQSVKHADI